METKTVQKKCYFHSQVTYWTTFTDPVRAVYDQSKNSLPYQTRYCPSMEVYEEVHNMILAHACAYRAFKSGGSSGLYSSVSVHYFIISFLPEASCIRLISTL